MAAFDVLGDPVRRRILESSPPAIAPRARWPRWSPPSSASASQRSRCSSECCARAVSPMRDPRDRTGCTPVTQHRWPTWGLAGPVPGPLGAAPRCARGRRSREAGASALDPGS